MQKTINKKELILETAAQLFYKHGYKASGVDFVAKTVGITKATLYHYFANKDALIEETLNYLSTLHKKGYESVWAKKGLTPVQKLTILFDEAADFLNEEDCYSCPFINVAGEYTDKNSFVRTICEDHYQFITNHLEQFAQEARLTESRLVAEKITILIAGTYATWYVGGITNAASHSKAMAEMVIRAHQA
jgi:AcrR family transcriptional regulator